MLTVNFADDQVNPAQLTVVRDRILQIPQARLVLLLGGRGHRSLMQKRKAFVLHQHEPTTIFNAQVWADRLGRSLRACRSRKLANDVRRARIGPSQATGYRHGLDFALLPGAISGECFTLGWVEAIAGSRAGQARQQAEFGYSSSNGP